MSKVVKGASWFRRLFPSDKGEILPTLLVTGGIAAVGVGLAIWKDINYPKILGKQQPQISELEAGARPSMFGGPSSVARLGGT